MAVGSQYAESPGLWDRSPAGRRRWADGRRPEEDAAGEDSPTVLTLSHFSRPPFLSFGAVRVGTSRTRHLALENPNAEPVRVAVCRPPPASKGFAVQQQQQRPCLLLQSRERISISITWTPLESGRVRELITFVVNDIVKLQAILLGTAEQPMKKKRSLWDTIKKRTPAQPSRCKKRLPNIKYVNATSRISEKPDGARNPLQSCENLEASGDSQIILENKFPLSPISPILQENPNVTCTPFSVRGSATYLVCDTAVCEVLQDIKESHTSVQLCDYLMEPQLKSAVQKTGSEETRSSNSVCTPIQIMHIPSNHRKILSPDAFVNNSYELIEEPVTAQTMQILSPDQFLKENQIAVQPSSQIHKFVSSSDVESSASKTAFPKWKESQQLVTFSVKPQLPKQVLSCMHGRELATFQCKELEQNVRFPAATDKRTCCFQTERPKKRPVLSSTVIKCKPDPVKGKGTEKVKSRSRKCLSNAIQQCVDDDPDNRKVEMLPNLPVIESFPGEANYHKAKNVCASSGSSSRSRKRKNGDYLEDVHNESDEYVDKLETKKILMSCVENEQPDPLKASISKSANRKKQSQKKRPGFLTQKLKTTPRRNNHIVPVAQSHLTFVKPLKAVIPRHPMPFVAKNMFYDERWKEKQQRGFTWWLNFVLTPDAFTVKTEASQVNAASLILGTESHHKFSVLKAPTKEEVSLRAYTARCKLNKLRRSACRLFTCDEMVKAIKRLETEIEARRLLVRKDRHLWKDIGERQKILNWLLCYNPLWLRIGLEAIYGELIALESNSDVMGLAMFILNRLLWNPDIAAEYRHPTVPHLYQEGHEDALSRFTLKKLLLLVCFLDRAKLSRIIEHDPCLFCKNAEFKSSKEILLAFSRDFLSGEGDLSRHLGFLGFPVNHVQTPLDEFDFAVTNLATDLQCGIRLVRAVELLSRNLNLSKKLRVPAISRLQKMHNVKIAFQVLEDHGIQLKDENGGTIEAKDIVDRHREKTLALLWKMVFAFQVDISLDTDQLKEEINFLKTRHATKAKMSASESPVNSKVRKDSGSFCSSLNYGENVKLLMDWVNAVCAFYNIKVENFTVSFSDGRVLCCLIHHYHPCYVPLEAISQYTTQTVECTKNGTLALNSSSESDASLNLLNGSFDQTITTSVLYKELLDNEKKNFQLINAAVSNLGGIPAMIHHLDMSNTIPDEKVVIAYVSFLCSRLLDLCKEIRAARLIQSVWREHRLKKKLAQTIKQKSDATVIIQKHWRRYLVQRELQKLKKRAKQEAEKVASVVIQTYWRRYCARRKYLQLRHCAILLQARIRMLLAVAAYKKVCWAVLTIQKRLRATLRAKDDGQNYQKLKHSALVIQSAFRRWKCRKMKHKIEAEMLLQTTELAKEERAALAIQSWYRMSRDRKNYLRIRQNVIKIQSFFRCIKAKLIYKEKRMCVLTIQKYYRTYRLGKMEREIYLQKCAAAVCLQSAFRRMKVRLLYRQIRAACVFQSLWRMRQERRSFLHLKHSVIVVQSYVRKHQQLKKYKAIKSAVSIIQARYRAHIACKKAVSSYQHLHCAAVVLQSAFRAKQARKEANMLKPVIKIQACFRAYVVRKRCLNLKLAVVKIQSFIKMKAARKYYCALREATRYVQRRYRSRKHALQLQGEYRKLRSTCILLQAVVRGNLVRKRIRMWQEAAVVLQAWYRMTRERRHFLRIRGATVLIQLYFRQYREQRSQRQKLLQVKKAAICLQAAYRGYRLRKTLKCQNMAAVTIQAAFRAHAARMKYQAMIQASLVIQRWYRASKMGSKIRKKFLKTKTAVTALQAASRGWQVRKWIREQHAAATIVQAAFRRYKALQRFRMMREAALTIQQYYRARVAGRKQRHGYVVLRNCIVQLQAAWRGSIVRKQIQIQHRAAVVIQSYYRMHIGRQKFQCFKGAAVTIQKWYRAVVLASCRKQEYLALKKATVKMQAIYRGVRLRRKIQRMHKAAVCIQAKFKMHRSKVGYQAMKWAATIIQRRYRAFSRGRKEQQKYIELRKSAFILQAAYRGMKARQELKTRHQSATAIQSFYRMYKQRKSFQKLTAATKLIQQWYRHCRDRNAQLHRYRQMWIATLQIQSAFRGMKTRHRLKKMHVAATTIQRRFRTYFQRQRFIYLKAATVTIQRQYRATVLSKQQRVEYLCLRKAAITMQSTFRGLLARKCMRRMQAAATSIQAVFRMHVVYTDYCAMKLASVTIQQHYRAYRETKRVREMYLKHCHSALVLQAAYRGMKTRCLLKKQQDSAKVIQSAYRRYRQQSSSKKMQWAARVIQGRFRANKLRETAVQHYSSVRRATICIQKAFRKMRTRQCQKRHLAAIVLQRSFKMQRDRRKYLAVKAAAVMIQKRYRALLLARRQAQEYLSLRTAVICVQSFYRGFKIRRAVRHMHSAARLIQAAFRMHRARLSFKRLRKAAVTIQWHYRSYQKGKLQQNAYLAIRLSALTIQAAYRGMKVRQELKAMHATATAIQALYRMRVQRKHYKRIRWAVLTLQSAYRGMVARKRTKEVHILRESPPCFHDAVDHRTAAVAVQTEYHTKKARVQHHKCEETALLTQQHDLSILAMKYQETTYLQTLKSVVMIQATIRGFIERQKFCRLKQSAIKIQRWYRAKLQRRRYLQYRKNTIKIQRMVRRWISCRNVAVAAVQEDKRQETLINGITKFQALWRGYLWRKKTDTVETKALRDSLLIANQESKEEKKLCNRTALAIDRLLKYKHFSYILAALKDLEVVTRLSPVCCESMAQSEAISTIFTLIRSCNRSIPCMDVIRYSVQVLLNLSKYEKTIQAVYAVENSVDTILALLQMYRERAGDKTSEKGGSIFTKTCYLLALSSKDSRTASDIRDSPRVVARLQRLFKLTARKQQIDAQRMVAKRKTEAYINGHVCVPIIPVKTNIVSRQRPDWVLRKDNMQEIVEPLQAIQMVMDTLGISYS
ncbi:abnormal spindle-like microcephaly-associated protein [Hemicordylus capensis]|uniref:abnormal spindle-like microcephaly-associated protein n=1 Tax=Hemicordylus capensis TaxID=884348 RepID=UPI002304CA87|nr:abnormal spindle-like microcephaly-associated protein [Hemicordylus capensis]